MSTPLNATFFTLQSRDRSVLLPATGVFALCVAVLVALVVGLNWRFFADLGALFHGIGGKEVDSAAGAALVLRAFGLIGSALLFAIFFYMAMAAYEAACLRWMLRGEAPGLVGFTFDHDMWRVYGVYWCWVGVHYAVSFVSSIVTLPIVFGTMGSLMSEGKPDPAVFWRWEMTTMLPISMLQLLPLAFLAVRLSPAAATSVARQRFSFFEAWKVTRGRFLPLLGSFALIWLLAGLAGAILWGVIGGALIARLWPLVITSAADDGAEAARTFFTTLFAPENLAIFAAGYAGQLAVGLGLMLMSFGVNARAAQVALEEGKIAVEPAT